MYTVQKKSGYEEAKPLLIQAFRDHHSLTWDRYDAMQPQDGFGRLGISCTECLDGPCRVNPFGDGDQATICGRDREDLVANFMLQKIYAGAEAMDSLAASFGAGNTASECRCRSAADRMLGSADVAEELSALAPRIIKTMRVLSQARPAVSAPYSVSAGFGVAADDRANIAVHGNVPPRLIKQLLDKAGKSVAVIGLCGAEGYYGMPVLGNYGSQELALINGAIDLIILGEQDVMPSFKRLAFRLGIPMLRACALDSADGVQKALNTAEAQRKSKSGSRQKPFNTPKTLCTGYTAANSGALFEAMQKACARGGIRGFAYLGGSGTISHTQDSDLAAQATALLQEGYVLATSGGVGTALARAGMCSPDFAIPTTLRNALPAGTPAVLHLGAGYDAALFFDMAAECEKKGIPTLALVLEPVSGKDMAIAVGLAGSGIPTYLDSELFSWLPESLMAGFLRPLSARNK